MPSIWASKVPFGLTTPHPNNFAEITRAIRENKDRFPFAWHILRRRLRRLRAGCRRAEGLDHRTDRISAMFACGCCG